MLRKELGRTGTQVPEIGLGTWDYHGGVKPLIAGLDTGALFVDTAESYGSEPTVAEALAGRRDSVFLATKVSPHNFCRKDILRALDGSLQRLRTDRIDLYQLHKPNEAIPLEETLGALEEAVDAGKIRHIGVSNFSVIQLARARQAMSRHPIVSNQVRFNLIDRTIMDELLPYCQANHVTVIAYSPLARGFGHILDCDSQGVIGRIARDTGRTPVQVALNWCLCHDGVITIPKGNSAGHVVENCGGGGWRLSLDQVRELGQKLVFRRRSGFETFLRQHLPPAGKAAIQRLLQLAPRRLRRRII